jgi:SAM-dependent methyltransferase
MKQLYVQYGCGKSAPEDWINFDVSPTLRLQKLPLFGTLLRKRLNTQFPENARYGDIIQGLPKVKPETCSGIYCSHVLEHLSLKDFRKALRNTRDLLKPGGIFRCVVPDLEYYIRMYIDDREAKNPQASFDFIRGIHMGAEDRPKNLKSFITSFWGNSMHQWMWDRYSLKTELELAGFSVVRECSFNDSVDEMFLKVESEGRFRNAVAFEAVK